jgi:two-component system, NtrC family, response regulator HydG
MKKILIIEDDLDISMLLKRFLGRQGFEVITTASGSKGLTVFSDENPDLVLCDFRLGDMDGSEVLQKIKEKNYTVPVIIITGYSDIKVAVKVIKQGAYDYIIKPLFPDEILHTIKKALDAKPGDAPQAVSETSNVVTPSSASRLNASSNGATGKYHIGRSEASQKLYRQIDLVAPTNFSVILYGESGSGKEAVAQMIHARSPRKDQPFVAMDCGAISKELAGSELFGHEKGSFTGAFATKIGHFELANGGTLFLDEVANLSYEVQASLLRVLQERKVKRIGGTKEIMLDVRILVASNENLAEAYRKGKFREDLYHRFNEFSIHVPALRERKEDIMEFAHFFLESTNRDLGKNLTGFDPEVVDQFLTYPWFGNLREMKNVIKRAALLSEGTTIQAIALPQEINQHQKFLTAEPVRSEAPAMAVAAPVPAAVGAGGDDGLPNLKAAAHEAEYEMILRVLKQCNYNKSKAAKILNIDRKTLYNKMKAFNI